MGGKGISKVDRLVIKRGLTCVDVDGTKYLCTYTGSDGHRKLASVAEVVGHFTSINDANFAARRRCEKDLSAFVGIDTREEIYVAVEVSLDDFSAAQSKASGKGGNGKGRTDTFARFHGNPTPQPDAPAATSTKTLAATVDHRDWAEGIALRYADFSLAAMRINAIDELPSLCTDQERRDALVIAFRDTAEVYSSEPDRAAMLVRIAKELQRGTLRLFS
jgi:hypothetical protein